MDISKILVILEKRPLMLIGEINIFMLATFLNGFFFGKGDQILSLEEKDFRNNFHNWICCYYESPLSNAGWAATLLFYEGSHSEALAKFIELYKLFKDRSKQ